MREEALQFNLEDELVDEFVWFDDLLFDLFYGEYRSGALMESHVGSSKPSLA